MLHHWTYIYVYLSDMAHQYILFLNDSFKGSRFLGQQTPATNQTRRHHHLLVHGLGHCSRSVEIGECCRPNRYLEVHSVPYLQYNATDHIKSMVKQLCFVLFPKTYSSVPFLLPLPSVPPKEVQTIPCTMMVASSHCKIRGQWFWPGIRTTLWI